MKVITTTLQYEQIRLIGSGNFGSVYLVNDPQLGGTVAVKEIPKAKFKNVSEFFAEAQAMFAAEHPNVVQIKYACAAGGKNGHVCLAMPYYKNGSLHDLIEKAPLSLVSVIRFGQDISTGLTQIHQAGFLHLDTKPSNILIADNGEAMVADFGQVKAIGAGGLVVSPLMYNSAKPPEVIVSDHASVQSDVYQAGLTLYRAVNGNWLWNEQLAEYADLSNVFNAITRGKFPRRQLFMPHVPRLIRTTIRKALRTDPAERYASVIALGDALGRAGIALDWQTTLHPDGSITWRAPRKSQCSLIVELRRRSKSNWEIEFWGDSGKPRARHTPEWRSSRSRLEAWQYLTDCFQKLEQAQNKGH